MTSIEKTLIDLYVQFDTPVNELPYTETLASITASLNTKLSVLTTAGMVWYILVRMHRLGRLPDIRRPKNIDLINFAVAQQYKTITEKELDDGLMMYANKSLVENVEAIVGRTGRSGMYWSSKGVIAVVKDAIEMMSKKES